VSEVAVTIVIVTYNNRHFMGPCLGSIRAHAGVPVQVVVVDNASSDGTPELIAAEFPEVELVRNAGNVGFPPACNQGARLARGGHVLFLNPDTELLPGALPACVAELAGDPGVGIVGCRLSYPDGRIQYAGGRNEYRLAHLVGELLYLHVLLPSHPRFGHHLIGDWDHTGVRDVEAVSGAFLLIRREALAAVGGMPAEIFMGHEDLAICLRVRRAGWRVRYRGDVAIVHVHPEPSPERSRRVMVLEGAIKVSLIRERDGALAGAAARVLFGVRSALRLAVAGVALLIPGLGGVRRRYPRLFSAGLNLDLLLWSISPRLVERRMPRAPAQVQPVVALEGS
jgi:N-acetylglucosaminyl-diphospho-decaprenol L-rhamnosyltransferase